MSGSAPKQPASLPATKGDSARKKRLAEALRANLKRRKAAPKHSKVEDISDETGETQD